MKLFDISLGNGSPKTAGLYYRGKAAFHQGEKSLKVAKGEVLSFGTYFNLFPHHEYHQYCDIDCVLLHLDIVGDCLVSFFCKNSQGVSIPLKSEHLNGSGTIRLPLSDFSKGGYIYFSITANSDCIIRGGAWETEKEIQRKIRLGIVICTYKREEFVKNNITLIEQAIQNEPVWAERLHVFIVDNACSLTLEKRDFYTIIPNRNLGGSGGFARGMYEVSKNSEFTHFLLMDDDIRFDFSVLARTYHLLSALSPQHYDASIGGAMLKLENPCIQHEFGGLFKGLAFKSINPLLDMRTESNLIKNQNAPKADYNAWWYCCMPAEFIKKYGLPMPFFIKSDDVEYGLRTTDKLILMNGISVWHQDFSAKYTGALEYYIKRNSMVTAALHHKSNRVKAAILYAYFLFKELCLKNYDAVELLLRAYRDYKKGPSFLLDCDPVALNEEIHQNNPDFLSKKVLEETYGPLQLPCHSSQKRHRLRSAFLMLMDSYMPARFLSDGFAVTGTENPMARDCFRKKTVVRYSPNSGTGFVCTFDAARRRQLRRASARTILNILFFYGKYKRMYLKNRQNLCSKSNWEKLFFPPSSTEEHI